MEQYITLRGQTISYTLRPNKRSKRVSVTLYPDGRLIVSTPQHISKASTERFLKKSQDWVLRQLEKQEKSDAILIHSHKKKEEALYREYARLYVERKIKEINNHYGFRINRISIKNHKAQWGSASHKLNLNFNYKLIFLPPHLSEYVLVHELCHLQEMNHSKKFWDLVGETVPNPKKLDKELSRYHLI